MGGGAGENSSNVGCAGTQTVHVRSVAGPVQSNGRGLSPNIKSDIDRTTATARCSQPPCSSILPSAVIGTKGPRSIRHSNGMISKAGMKIIHANREGGGAYAEGGRAVGRSHHLQKHPFHSSVQTVHEPHAYIERERHRSPPTSGDEPDAKNAKNSPKMKDGTCGLDAIVAVALTEGSPVPEELRSSSGSASGSEGSSGDAGGRKSHHHHHPHPRDSPTPESGRDSGQGSGKDDNFHQSAPPGDDSNKSSQSEDQSEEDGEEHCIRSAQDASKAPAASGTQKCGHAPRGSGSRGADDASANEATTAHTAGTLQSCEGGRTEQGTLQSKSKEVSGSASQDTGHYSGMPSTQQQAHAGQQSCGESEQDEGEREEGDDGGVNADASGAHAGRPKLPRPEGPVACPRCKSEETKFCYYNNYNIKQPRHFCKSCQRYWTAGGMLRNVPVGAGRRKNKNGCAPPTSPVPPGGSGPVPMAELTSLPMAGGMPINCQTLAMQHAHAVMAAAQAHPNCKRETLSRTSTVDAALRWPPYGAPATSAAWGYERGSNGGGSGEDGSAGSAEGSATEPEMRPGVHSGYPQSRLMEEAAAPAAFAWPRPEHAARSEVHDARQLKAHAGLLPQHMWTSNQVSMMREAAMVGMPNMAEAAAAWGAAGHSSTAAAAAAMQQAMAVHAAQQQGAAWPYAAYTGSNIALGNAGALNPTHISSIPYSQSTPASAGTEFPMDAQMASAAYAHVLSRMTTQLQQPAPTAHDAQIFASGWNAANAAATGGSSSAAPSTSPWGGVDVSNMNMWSPWGGGGGRAARSSGATSSSSASTQAHVSPPTSAVAAMPSLHAHPAMMANPPAMWRSLQIQQAQAAAQEAATQQVLQQAMQQAASEAARRAHHHLPLQQYPLAPADAMSQLSQSTSTSHSHTAQSLAQAKSVHLPQAPGQTIAPTNPEHGYPMHIQRVLQSSPSPHPSAPSTLHPWS